MTTEPTGPKPLTFEIGNTGSKELRRAPRGEIADHAWPRFASEVQALDTLVPTSWPALKGRWKRGRAAVAVYKGEIISYISALPAFDSVVGSHLNPSTRHAYRHLPSFELLVLTTGWTATPWRRRGLSLQLRRHLLARLGAHNRQFVSVAIGVGAGPVAFRLGWRVIGFDALPYLGALLALPPGLTSCARRPPVHRAYCGPHPGKPLSDQAFWQSRVFLWAASPFNLRGLDRQLRDAISGLDQWRNAIAELHSRAPLELFTPQALSGLPDGLGSDFYHPCCPVPTHPNWKNK